MPTNHIKRTQINVDGRPAPLIARVNRRAKRLILKVDAIAGEIHVTAPSIRALPDAIRFAEERREWIATQLDLDLRARPFSGGGLAPLRGEPRKLVHRANMRTPAHLNSAGEIEIGGALEHCNRRVVDWLKGEARRDLTVSVDKHCARLGRTRKTLRIGDTRTRWGSCSSEGVLSFSWRLIMAPPDILDYVAAHECAHLLHMNHSPAFWRCVKDLGVDPRPAETWLRDHGAKLFSYGAKAAAPIEQAA